MKKYSFEEATGVIDYGFTNDYMFRAILQKNKKVLKALICALLHLAPTRFALLKLQTQLN